MKRLIVSLALLCGVALTLFGVTSNLTYSRVLMAARSEPTAGASSAAMAGRATGRIQANGRQAANKKPFPVTIVDDLHNRVVITSQPNRIVSLDPRDTETLFALGLEKRVVGDGGKNVEGASGFSRKFRYPSEWPSPWGSDYPIRSKQLPHVEGGYSSAVPFNLETIESLHPDLIFSLRTGDQQTFQKMRDLGLKVVILDPPNFRGVLHDINLVATATGAAKQASVVIRNMKKAVQSVQQRVSRVRSHPRTYYEIDATNPTQPYVAGPGTYIDEAIRLAGGTNVVPSVTYPGCPGTGCYPTLALEAIIKYDPQIIVLGDAAYGVTVDSVKNRSGWATISAVRSGKIYPFDDELISRAGPRIVIGIQKLARLVHPAAFRSRQA